MIPFQQRISRIIFKICSSGSCLPSRTTKQTYSGNFTCPQTHFGCPKPLGKCQVTPLYIHVSAGVKRIYCIITKTIQKFKDQKSVDSYSPDPGGETTFYGSYKIAVLIWPVCSGKGLYALLQIFRKSFEKKTKEFSGFTEKCFHNEIFKIRWQFYCNTSSLRKDKPQFVRRVIPPPLF